jgi:hypothetical protein
LNKRVGTGYLLKYPFTTVHGFMHSAIMNFHRFTTCSPLMRLLRHYFVVQCYEYSYTSLVSIFNTILERYYNHDKLDFNYCYQKNLIQSISTTYVQVYLKLKAPIILPNNNECQQYVIHLHDLFVSSKGYYQPPCNINFHHQKLCLKCGEMNFVKQFVTV